VSDEKYYEAYWKSEIVGGLYNDPIKHKNIELDRVLAFCAQYIGESVLDAGGGKGELAHLIKQNTKASNVVSVDIAKKAAVLGKKKYKDVTFKTGKIEQLSSIFSNNSFDTVISMEVLEHLLDIDQCLIEINRVLKPGGYLCVSTTDFNLPKKIIIASLFWDKYFYPNNPHIRFFTKKTLADICNKHGLKQVAYKWNKSYYHLMPLGQLAVFEKYKNSPR